MAKEQMLPIEGMKINPAHFSLTIDGEVWRDEFYAGSKLMKSGMVKVDKFGRVRLNDGWTVQTMNLIDLMDARFPDGHNYVHPRSRRGRPAMSVYAWDQTEELKFKNVDDMAEYLQVSPQTIRNALSNDTTVKGLIVSHTPKPVTEREAVVEDGLITFTWR